MRIVSYVAEGSFDYGILRDDGITSLRHIWPDLPPSLGAALRGGLFDRLAGFGIDDLVPDIRLDAIARLPPIPDPGKIVCIGKNYAAHVLEGGREIAPHPSVFLRMTNTLVPHEGVLMRPRVSEQFDFEGEVAVIIGRSGRHIPRDDALSYIGGYSLFQDASVRDWQFGHSLAAGKNFIATGGFGPWIVTADEIVDPGRIALCTRLNGVQVQASDTSKLIHDIGKLIAYVSTFTEFQAGDVLVTGTPEGVGFARKPPLWLRHGDVVEVEAEGIGLLRNHVRDEE